MGRLLRPVDIAATVGHLLSDASAMMTGTIVDLHPEVVSGGGGASVVVDVYRWVDRDPLPTRLFCCRKMCDVLVSGESQRTLYIGCLFLPTKWMRVSCVGSALEAPQTRYFNGFYETNVSRRHVHCRMP